MIFFLIFGLVFLFRFTEGIYCYVCVSTEPGCGHELQPYMHRGVKCPLQYDSCVKITEFGPVDEVITRGCLSAIEPIRRDIPADKYEGCRDSATDPKLAVYVNTTFAEHDVKRDKYLRVQFCMCMLDEECNAASSCRPSALYLAALILVVSYFLTRWKH